MTALNFPATPSDGDTFDNYIYDGVKEVWRIQPNIPGISSRFKVSATAPTNPADGEVWLNSTDGNTYIYYSDGDTAQWIEIGGTTGNPPILGDLNDVTITSPTTDQLLRWNGSGWVNGTANTNSVADGAVTAPKLAKTAGAVMVFADSAARGSAIPTPSEGMITYLSDTNAVEKYDGAAFVGVADPPAILQVVSATKTDTFSASVATGGQVAVTGLTSSITPSSTSSKILVAVAVPGQSGNGLSRSMGLILTVGGSAISGAVGDAASARVPVTFTGPATNDNQAQPTVSGSFLYSPATTSALTFGVNVVNLDSVTNTLFVNRSNVDGDNKNSGRTISTITLMEVAG